MEDTHVTILRAEDMWLKKKVFSWERRESMALYYQRETDKDTDEDSVGEGKEALMLLYCTWKTS